MNDFFLSLTGLLKSSPPQLRGGAKRRGGAGQRNHFLTNTTPASLRSAFPSSAEEGSFGYRSLIIILLFGLLFHAGVQHASAQKPPSVPLPQAVPLPPNMTLTTRLDRTAVWVGY